MASRSTKYMYLHMGLCLYLTDSLKKINDDPEIRSVCDDVVKTSHKCINAWGEVLTVKELRALRSSLRDIFKKEEEAVKVSSFILGGLEDISKRVKSSKKITINNLIDQVVKLQSLFDENLSNVSLYDEALMAGNKLKDRL